VPEFVFIATVGNKDGLERDVAFEAPVMEGSAMFPGGKLRLEANDMSRC